jgi:hypothetical protein
MDDVSYTCPDCGYYYDTPNHELGCKTSIEGVVMARTTPENWVGLTPTLTDEKVETIQDLYQRALGDEDKAGTIEDAAFYEGWQSALRWVLDVLHDKETDNEC